MSYHFTQNKEKNTITSSHTDDTSWATMHSAGCGEGETVTMLDPIKGYVVE